MSKTTIKSSISANIKQNGNQEISGNLLGSIMRAMVDDYTEQAAHDALVTEVRGKYVKPSTGIPKTDLSASVQASLAKADVSTNTPVVDNLNSDSTTSALSAKQGKYLNGQVQGLYQYNRDWQMLDVNFNDQLIQEWDSVLLTRVDGSALLFMTRTNDRLVALTNIEGAWTTADLTDAEVGQDTTYGDLISDYILGCGDSLEDLAHRTGDEEIAGLKTFLNGLSLVASNDNGECVQMSSSVADDANILTLDGTWGNVILRGLTKDPVGSTDAANKNYVDNHHDSTKANNSDVVHIGGDETISGKKTFQEGVTIQTDWGSFRIANSDIHDGADVTGIMGTFGFYGRGNALVPISIADPTNNNHAATKNYVDALDSKIGNLSELTTTAKDSAVAAINELKSAFDALTIIDEEYV